MDKMVRNVTGARWGAISLWALLLLALGMAAAVPAQAQRQPTTQRQTTTPPPAPPQTVPTYVLGVNDVITVQVFGQTEFNVTTRIKPDGSITMPLIGDVRAAGQTVVTLADEVGRRLESGNFLRGPIVNIEVQDFASRFVRVTGRVGSPGLVPLMRSVSLLDVLLMSGWMRDDGSPYVLVRQASTGREIRIERDQLARGLPEADILVNPGDTLFVPEGELVYITGSIGRPGAYPMRRGMTIEQLILTAGGPGAAGSINRFQLRRAGTREEVADLQTVLQPGDVVTMRERLF